MTEGLPKAPPMSRDSIERRMYAFMRQACPGSLRKPQPTPVLELLEFEVPRLLDFTLDVQALPDSIEGATDFHSRRVILDSAVYDGVKRGDGRARFTACHEIAHAILHSSFMAGMSIHKPGRALYRKDQLKPYEDPEWQAHSGGSALLMPSESVRTLAAQPLNTDLESQVRITFNASSEASRVRLEVLKQKGIIN